MRYTKRFNTHEPWFVYVLRGEQEGRIRYYVGCTKNVERRVRQHNGELPGGARFTKAYRPWSVCAVYGPYLGRGEAQRIEYEVKRLNGEDRARWMGHQPK